MSTTKKSDDDLMQQLQEAALETVRLQARRSMSPEEQRLLANNLINILLGRGLPKERCWSPRTGICPQSSALVVRNR